MKIKILAEGQYIISAIMVGDACPVEASLLEGDPNYESTRNGLLDMINRAANNGLNQFSSKLSHSINDNPRIYEFVRGKLRLIYFHGEGNNIVVSTEVIVKKTQKVDKRVVNRAITAHNDYFESIGNNTLIKVRDDENENE